MGAYFCMGAYKCDTVAVIKMAAYIQGCLHMYMVEESAVLKVNQAPPQYACLLELPVA